MNIPLLDLKREYKKLECELLPVVADVMASSQYIMGDEVTKIEKTIAEYIGVKHAISCGNGTDALVLSLIASGIKEGDEVITSAFTYYATAESISSVGAKPIFIDVYRDSFNIDVSQIEEKITDRTRAIIPVHIFGQPADMDEITDIAEKYNLIVIEDTAQAIGGVYKGKKVGSIGDFGTFSFFPTKNLGAFGDGGMITTNSDKYAMILRALRNHGSGQTGKTAYQYMNDIDDDGEVVSKYYNYLVGFNSRLDAMQAAILNIKFKHLEYFTEKRKEIARKYDEQLKASSLITPNVREYVDAVYHLYIVQSEERQAMIEYLNDNGISTGVYYPVPLHLQKVYENLGYKEGDLPNSEYLSKRTFAIPMFPEMSEDEQDYIIEKIMRYK